MKIEKIKQLFEKHDLVEADYKLDNWDALALTRLLKMSKGTLTLCAEHDQIWFGGASYEKWDITEEDIIFLRKVNFFWSEDSISCFT